MTEDKLMYYLNELHLALKEENTLGTWCDAVEIAIWKLTARLLTLEECAKLADDGSPVWVEERDDLEGRGEWGIVRLITVYGGGFSFEVVDSLGFHYYPDDYNHSWRAWSLEPSVEQIRDFAWPEDDEDIEND